MTSFSVICLMLLCIGTLTSNTTAFTFPTNKISPLAFSNSQTLRSPSRVLNPCYEIKVLSSKNNDDIDQTNNDFWLAQKELAQSMTEQVDATSKREQLQLYEKRSQALVSESFFFSILIFNVLWFVCTNPFTPFSYLLGALLGTAYSFGLGKYVATLGGSADNEDDIKGAGVGSARFAFLIVLFIIVGKFRAQGLQEIPTIFGFFTYQLASLSQGLKEIDD